MSSSLKAYSRLHSRQQDDAKAQVPRQSSRIPTKQPGAGSGKLSKAAPHVSKLAKSAIRDAGPLESSIQSSTTRNPTPGTIVSQKNISSGRRVSATPSAAIAYTQPSMRTPSLVSGSSISTSDSPRAALRRKPSGAIDMHAAQKRNEYSGNSSGIGSAMHTHNESNVAMLGDMVLGIPLPSPTAHEQDDTEHVYGNHDYNANRDFAPAILGNYALSATPSTRYTGSPFSHVPTPSSVSSYSSGVLTTSDGPARSRQLTSPVDLHELRNVGKLASRQSLQPVRESSISSSGSTMLIDSKSLKAHEQHESEARGTRSGRRFQTKTLPVQDHQSPPLQSERSPEVPPELAHLNVDPPPSNTRGSAKALAPARPTREGTPDMSGMTRASPVIQSDLPRLYTTQHKRTPSQDTPVSASPSGFKSRFGFSSRSSSRNESPRIDSAISPPPSARHFHRGPTPEINTKEGAKIRRKDSPAVSSAPSPGKTSRFGLFHRRAKEPKQAKPVEKPKRHSVKGPAAGTGHEGYGRFGLRGRSSGSVSSSAGLRSSSTDSASSVAPPALRPQPPSRTTSSGSKDESGLDEFLKERLNPVILRGSGGTVDSTASSLDIVGSSLQPVSSQSSSVDSYAQPHLLPSAIPGASSGSPVRRSGPFGSRRPSDSSEDDVAARYPSLAARRSLARLSSRDNRSSFGVPPSIDMNLQPQNRSSDRYEGEALNFPQAYSSAPPKAEALCDNEELWLRPTLADPTVKTAKKLNFFQRMASPRSRGNLPTAQNVRLPEHAIHESPRRGVAHYAMVGPVEPIGLDEVKLIAQENDGSAEESTSDIDALPGVVPYEKRHVSLLPSPPKPGSSSDSEFFARPTLPRIMVNRQDSAETAELLRAQPAVAHRAAQMVDIPKSPDMLESVSSAACPSGTDHDQQPPFDTSEPGNHGIGTTEMASDPSRQPRLSPIGRIPAVVSKRDRDRKLSDISFSRPFARSQPRPSVKPPGSVYSQIREMASPIESGSQPVSSTSTAISDAHFVEPNSNIFAEPSIISPTRTIRNVHADPHEFFAFPPRKNSEQSYQSYSSSTGTPSWVSALYAQQPQQEDIWNEYNDFLDEIMPWKAPKAGFSLRAPFQYGSMLADSAVTRHNPPPSGALPLPPSTASTQGNVLTIPQQISRFLQASMSPTSPDTLSGFMDGYGNRSTGTSHAEEGHSMMDGSAADIGRTNHAGQRDSATPSNNSHCSRHPRTNSFPEVKERPLQSRLIPNTRPDGDTQLSNITKVPGDGHLMNKSLRTGALMTSKWLSFGRVLFSPAHHEIQFADEPKVLVIDGLSSDWSHFVALSYPEASIYNLTPSMPGSPSLAWPEADRPPPLNLHQIPMTSLQSPFPFPKGFFKSVVFRFPKATTEQAYTACVSECKRVLQPGGYLEVAVLDLDLMNMGSRTRKAVRGLKTRMQARDQEVCLRNLSDILVRMIGRRGFDTVQRCMVGVPAAGRIRRSQDLSSASSDSSGKSVWYHESRGDSNDELSIADLISDARESQFEPGKSNDETITKMVAKVGRWWYSTCYEKALLPTDQSIWADGKLLHECEKQGTSFRLLICHAQKPAQTHRRTVSV